MVEPQDRTNRITEQTDFSLQTTAQLIRSASRLLQDKGTNAVRTHILELQQRVSDFDQIVELCGSKSFPKRYLAAWVLGEFGFRKWPFGAERFAALMALLEGESEPAILGRAAHSLGLVVAHSSGKALESKAVGVLATLSEHPSEEVRLGVVHGLCGEHGCAAVRTLIRLSADNDAEVRDWATFGLHVSELDTPEIRDAFIARLDDEDPDVRSEALIGLASRGDKRVVPALLRELRSEKVRTLVVEAAEAIGDYRLRDALIELRAWGENDTALIERAISRCSRDPRRKKGRRG